MLNPEEVKIVGDLDPIENQINNENLIKFLGSFDEKFMQRKRTEKGPEYLIIDNFEKYFGLA